MQNKEYNKEELNAIMDFMNKLLFIHNAMNSEKTGFIITLCKDEDKENSVIPMIEEAFNYERKNNREETIKETASYLG